MYANLIHASITLTLDGNMYKKVMRSRSAMATEHPHHKHTPYQTATLPSTHAQRGYISTQTHTPCVYVDVSTQTHAYIHIDTHASMSSSFAFPLAIIRAVRVAPAVIF